MKSSCIQHPEREPLVILRQSYIELCDGDRCAAMLLANFEYWHNVKLDQSEQEVARGRDNPDYRPDISRWVYKSTADLISDLLGQYARDKILASVQLLIDKGYLQTKADPRSAMSRIRFFLLLPDAVNSDLMLRPSVPPGPESNPDSRKIDSRQSKNRPSVKSAKVGRTIVDKGTLESRISDSVPYTEITHSETTSSSSGSSSERGPEEEEDLTLLEQALAKYVVATPGQVRQILRVVRLKNETLSAADVAMAVPLAVPSGYTVRMWKYFVTALPGTVTSTRYLQEMAALRRTRASQAAEKEAGRRDRMRTIEELLSTSSLSDYDRQYLADFEEHFPEDVAEVCQRLTLKASA